VRLDLIWMVVEGVQRRLPLPPVGLSGPPIQVCKDIKDIKA